MSRIYSYTVGNKEEDTSVKDLLRDRRLSDVSTVRFVEKMEILDSWGVSTGLGFPSPKRSELRIV